MLLKQWIFDGVVSLFLVNEAGICEGFPTLTIPERLDPSHTLPNKGKTLHSPHTYQKKLP